MTHSITVAASDGAGDFAAYVAEPEGAPRAAVVVVQEIFGVNAGIRRKCDLLARDGYLAIAPDMFWRLKPGVEFDPDIPSAMKRGVELVMQFSYDTGTRDIQATIDAARALSGGRKVGLVGFCLGGGLAAFAAARTDVDASVGYYGVRIEKMVAEKDAIANPLMLHIPELDDHAPKDLQVALHRAFDSHPKVRLHDYPGEHHGFADAFGARRSEAAAELANGRTLAFFAEHLH